MVGWYIFAELLRFSQPTFLVIVVLLAGWAILSVLNISQTSEYCNALATILWCRRISIIFWSYYPSKWCYLAGFASIRVESVHLTISIGICSRFALIFAEKIRIFTLDASTLVIFKPLAEEHKRDWNLAFPSGRVEEIGIFAGSTLLWRAAIRDLAMQDFSAFLFRCQEISW